MYSKSTCTSWHRIWSVQKIWSFLLNSDAFMHEDFSNILCCMNNRLNKICNLQHNALLPEEVLTMIRGFERQWVWNLCLKSTVRGFGKTICRYHSYSGYFIHRYPGIPILLDIWQMNKIHPNAMDTLLGFGYLNLNTVFPRIVSAETILFWI